MKPICFYDKDNLDSVCGAAIVRHFVPECELCSFDEYTPRKSVHRTVYMVGCSLPAEQMKELAELCDLIWIDNRKVPLKAWFHDEQRPQANVTGDIRFGVGELTWSYFKLGSTLNDLLNNDEFGLPTIPEAVQLIGDYATGRGENPNAKLFYVGMKACGVTDLGRERIWRGLLEDDTAAFKTIMTTTHAGMQVLDYLQIQRDRVAREGAFEKTIRYNGRPRQKQYKEKYCMGLRTRYVTCWTWDSTTTKQVRCICLNTTDHTEEAFASVYDPEKHDLRVAFSMSSNGKWKLTFFGDKAEEVAKAIGNEVEVLPW